MGRRLVLALLLAGIGAATVRARPAGPPEGPRTPVLEVRAPGTLARDAARIRAVETGRLLAVMRLVGLDDPGPAIPITLVPEDTPLARHVPPAVAGFARGGDDVILFPRRTPTYPAHSIDEVVQHELAHVLIARAAGGQPVPRWFHEGVALAAERTWGFEQRADFAVGVATGGAVPVADLDAMFAAGPGQVRRAYALSGAFVRDLLAVHGADLPARVLAGMRAGRSFDEAFTAAAGERVADASDAFWRRRRFWVIWLPWLTSPATLYSFMGLLALVAALRVRARRAEKRRQRELEELELVPPPALPVSPDAEAPPERRETIH